MRRMSNTQKKLPDERERVEKPQKEVNNSNKTVADLKKTKKNWTEQLRYNVNMRSKVEKQIDANNTELKEKLKKSETENKYLQYQRDEIM